VGTAVHDAPAGMLVMVPGVSHTFANPGDQPVVLINTFSPDLYVQYLRDLRDAMADGTPQVRAAAGVTSRYATTVVTDFA
jgi:oxalate decarboxylase/phosphoglucose isomerase-like protein (cupin superfamily)